MARSGRSKTSSQRKLVIFDFDGTLADTFDLFLRGFDEAADVYQFSRFDRANLTYVRGLDARGVMRHHHVPMWKLPFGNAGTIRTHCDREYHFCVSVENNTTA